MIRAGFVSSSPQWHWERQFPGSRPVWDGVEFVFSGSFDNCDIVFVFDAVPDDLSGRLSAPRSMFIASEPASVKTYNHDFLAQFDRVLTTDRSTRHPHVIFGQLGLPWHVGVWDNTGAMLSEPMTLDDFEVFQPTKTKSVSVVTSNKAFTEGHRARLEFVRRLKAYFGDEIDLFGRNINNFGDKLEVLSEYRYHIAIENSSYDDYWTEKLSDPFLTNTYPIYYGCANISQYFDLRAVSPFDLADEDGAIATIKRLIESDEAERVGEHMREAKRKVLREHNLFAILAKAASTVWSDTTGRRHSLFTEREHVKNKVRFKLKKMISAARNKL
ncbi:glycosyltransferase family 10 domain-containing protein [Roseibium sp.]|uniref:glycosyltransferase family 10 domain-containing protein n=1 Tax=Roseibium sp. TaxID=1936156 RepID=UPI003BABE403